MESKIILPCYSKYLIFIYIVGMVLNIALAKSLMLIIPTIFEILVVLLFVLKGNLKKAAFLHLVFMVLCFDVTTGLGNDTVVYSYYKLKIIGLVGVNQIIGLLLYIIVRLRYPKIAHFGLLYKAYKVFIYLAISGTIIGVFGVCFYDYEFKAILTPLVYIISAIIYTEILLRLCSCVYLRLYYENAIYLIVAAPIACAFCFNILGVSFKYGTVDAFIYHDVYVLVPSLLIALFQVKGCRFLFLISIICYAVNLYVGGRGIHFMMMAICLVIYIYILYTSPQYKYVKLGFPFLSLGVVSYIVGKVSSASQLAVNKFTEMISLVNLINGQGAFLTRIQSIQESPLVRIGEFLNICYQGIYNPLGLMLGKGYGGYFFDYLGIFRTLTLAGAYSTEVIALGRYNSAHTVFPCALLYNGVIGLFMILRLGLLSLIRIKTCFLYFAGVALFCYSFYFNPIALVSFIFILYGSMYIESNKFVYIANK